MRLKKTQKILLDNLDGLNIIKKTTNNNNWNTISDYSKLIGAINNIKETGIIDNEFDKLDKESYFSFVAGDQVKMDSSRFGQLTTIVNTISAKVTAVLFTIEQVLPHTNEDNKALVINFPSDPFTISKFKLFIDRLDRFSKTLIKLEFEDSNNHSEEPVVSHFDVGSEWLVMTFSFIGFIPLIVKAANDIQDFRIKNRQIKLLDHEIDQLNLDPETKVKLVAAIEEKDDKIGEDLAPNLIENSSLINSPENEATVIQLIKQLDDIFSLGISFERGVNLETKKQENFPIVKEQKSISKNKEIDNPKDD